MATRPRMSREYAARLIWQALTFDSPPDGLTLKEICSITSLSVGQARAAMELLRDSLHERGGTLNVSRDHRYSIPKASADDESKEHDLRRIAELCDTRLRRTQIKLAADREHHPHERAWFDGHLNDVNRARKALARIIGWTEDEDT